jgi:hypothetical protein
MHDVLFLMGEGARDEREMGKFWQDIKGALDRNGGVGDVEGGLRG